MTCQVSQNGETTGRHTRAAKGGLSSSGDMEGYFLRRCAKYVVSSSDAVSGSVTSSGMKKRKYQTEDSQKMKRPEIITMPAEDQWKSNAEILKIMNLTNGVKRHYQALYAFSYRGRLLHSLDVPLVINRSCHSGRVGRG